MLKLYGIRLKFTEQNISLVFKRYKNHPNHWSVLRKKKSLADVALAHLDEFYGSTFGERWTDIKTAILRPNKYVAVVNNFSDDVETMEHLEEIGALNIKDVFMENKEILKYKLSGKPKILKNDTSDIDTRIAEMAQQLTEEEFNTLYGQNAELKMNSVLDTGGATIGHLETNSVEAVEKSKELDEELLSYEESRLIYPEGGISSFSLQNYIPTTKIKGMEDWLPESLQFKYYLDSKDFPVNVEEDDTFEIPHYLNIYTFGRNEKKKFFEPKVGKANVANYYLMDGASIFPVIALNPTAGERVLDMCAGPGGKSLLLLQTMMPNPLIANDKTISRTNRIHKVMREYLYDYKSSTIWQDRIIITQSDGRHIKDDLKFDKILVDVPCTADRHTVRDSFENIFQNRRLKERLKLPELQSDLLCNALNLCKIGGTVVYSTCTLSPIENDGVIKLGLKKALERHKIEATVKLYKDSILPLRGLFQLGEGTLSAKYGHVIVPHASANFGPAYFARLVRNE